MSVYLPPRRRHDFHDEDGMLSFSHREDEITPLVIDWSDELAGLGSAVTISSVAYADSGVTRNSTSNTTTTTTTHVTGIGETEITVTCSSGDKLQRVVRFYETQGAGASDYA